AQKDGLGGAGGGVAPTLSPPGPGPGPRLRGIAKAQRRARNIQVHFDTPEVQRQAGRLGASDTLNSTRLPDFLLETEDNYGGSKTNFFPERSFPPDLSLVGSRLPRRLTVGLHDNAPADRPLIGPAHHAYL